RFGDVGFGDGGGGFEVGDGAGDAADLVVGAGAEAEFVHGLLHEQQAGVGEVGVLLELAGVHAGVGGGVAEAAVLDFAGLLDLAAHGGAVGAGAAAGQFA